MHHYDSLEAMGADCATAPYLAIGTFDGLHRGHLAVLAALLRAGRLAAAPCAVLTFVPHPLSILSPQGAPLALTTGAQRIRLLTALGLDALVELPFDRTLASLSPAEFVAEYLCRRARVHHAFVGADFTFGAGASGTAETLAVLGSQLCQLRVTTVPLVTAGGTPISSTRIRQVLRDGHPGLAARLLGRPFALEGVVQPGDRRGATLGFPTANVSLSSAVVWPAPGVYAARVAVVDGPGGADLQPGIANLGVRPTFGGATEPRLEAHIFDFQGDLYGKTVEVQFIRRLRGERKFVGSAALRAQIARDAARARRVLATPVCRASEVWDIR